MTARTAYRATIQRYISLTKPGVLFGNVITGVAGFLLASGDARQFNLWLFLATIAGMTLIIASACTLNNVLDQDIDSKMERTKKRAIVAGQVPALRAALFSVVLGLLGIITLYLWTNMLVVIIGIVGFIDYVLLYGMLSKRLSIHGTLVGSISGSAPILAGYCAVTGRVDVGAVLVFAALFFWQLPEFYSIAIYRHDEYKAAGVPVMPVVKGAYSTKAQILVYTILFLVAAFLLTSFHYTGYIYLAVMAVVGGYWLLLAVKGLRKNIPAADAAWARKMFRLSLNVLLVYSFMIAVGALLP